MGMPRNLRLLQIDVELPGPRSVAFIDTVTINGVSKPGIDRWEVAIEFWNGFEASERIDLITADVRFTADHTSPLWYDETFRNPNDAEREEFLIPTGLSHVKPFAAIARATGRPI